MILKLTLSQHGYYKDIYKLLVEIITLTITLIFDDNVVALLSLKYHKLNYYKQIDTRFTSQFLAMIHITLYAAELFWSTIPVTERIVSQTIVWLRN